jgi:hypothetical protein
MSLGFGALGHSESKSRHSKATEYGYAVAGSIQSECWSRLCDLALVDPFVVRLSLAPK